MGRLSEEYSATIPRTGQNDMLAFTKGVESGRDGWCNGISYWITNQSLDTMSLN